MNLQSLKNQLNIAGETLQRFTLSMVCAIMIFGISSYLTFQENENREYYLFKMILVFILGISLFFACDIWSETQNKKGRCRIITNLIGVLFLSGYYAILPADDSDKNTAMVFVYYTIIFIIIHLLVAIAPSFTSKTKTYFWTFNKNLFLRCIVSLFYSGVIYLGLFCAIISLDPLFNIKIEGEYLFVLFIFCTSILNIWIFLSGIDKDLTLQQPKKYPQGLKIFTQFILIPILTIYFIILYTYCIYTLIHQDWSDSAYLSSFIIVIAVLGYLTNLLLYPYFTLNQKTWIKTYYKALYYLLIPLSIILFYVTLLFISKEGFNIKNYFIFMTSIWIFIISIYQILYPGSIKVIPISLIFVLCFSTFGPWGVEHVSEVSQVNLLREKLTDLKVLKNEKLVLEYKFPSESILVQKTEVPQIDQEEVNEIESILYYLNEYHSLSSIYSWFEQDIAAIKLKEINEQSEYHFYSKAEMVEMMLGLKYYTKKNKYPYYINFHLQSPNVINVKGWDYTTTYYDSEYCKNYFINKYLVELYFTKNRYLDIIVEDELLKSIDVLQYIEQLKQKYPDKEDKPTQEELTIHIENDQLKMELRCYDLSLRVLKDSSAVSNINIGAFIKIKK